ncbi:NnrU family protein [Ponticaulis sp.]|uniref:NnrU family protein n=1 Tax=Ponticaulis sp. TaxID=2020902 RepID=UPI0025FB3EAB|nr:NnrU family protein [Ponticaulis sp.]|tara:strand:- start:1896 stop:2471 length:576 start_codon:yes stop_codon:yes gene_type:complete
MLIFLIGLIGFLGIHSVHAFMPGFRSGMIAKMGAMPWKGVYALISIVFFVLMVIGYPGAQASTIYFGTVPEGMKHINSLLIPIALVLAVAGSLPRGYIARTLKHPQLVGVKLWALGHLLVNWDLTSFLFFGGFLAWAVLVRISIKKRPPVAPKAPNIIWDIVAVLAGLALTGWLMMSAHVYFFNVSPIPGM